MNVLAWLAQHWLWAVAGLVVFVFGVWTVQEYQRGNTGYDAGIIVGGKARKWTGGITGFFAAASVGLLGALWEASMNLSEFGNLLGEIIASAPQMIGGIVLGGLGALGLEGTVALSGGQLLGLTLIIMGGATIVANRTKRARKREEARQSRGRRSR
ncbi:hypothetical protein [Haladaptatus sp. ZSTT2]|uniref:hypothetical protein n=1 Tax=Haladaptatus sp. ZSTT2 TaxID=3120515 RepID=UPI00300F26FC